jgi:hypothetical protein
LHRVRHRAQVGAQLVEVVLRGAELEDGPGVAAGEAAGDHQTVSLASGWDLPTSLMNVSTRRA